MNMMSFLWNKSLITYQKKKYIQEVYKDVENRKKGKL